MRHMAGTFPFEGDGPVWRHYLSVEGLFGPFQADQAAVDGRGIDRGVTLGWWVALAGTMFNWEKHIE